MFKSTDEKIHAAAVRMGCESSYFDGYALLFFTDGIHEGQQEHTCKEMKRTFEGLATGRCNFIFNCYAKYGDTAIWGNESTVTMHVAPSKHLDPANLARALAVEVYVSWSSTGRSVASAMVAIETYQKALAFAAKVEAFVAGRVLVVVPEAS